MKRLALRAVCIMVAAVFLISSTAFAKEHNGKGNGKWSDDDRQEIKVYYDDKGHGLGIKLDDENELNNELKDEIKAENDSDEAESVSKSVYKSVYGSVYNNGDFNGKRFKGLLKKIAAIEAGYQDASLKDLIKLALSYKAIGQYDKAIKVARDILKEDPGNKKAIIILAQIYRDTKNYDAAKKLVEDLMKDDTDSSLKAFLAILHEDRGELKKAETLLKDAIRQSYKAMELYKEIGKLYKKLGRKGFKVFINGQAPEFDIPPVVENNRLLVPVRKITENLGMTVNYNPSDKTVTCIKDGTEIVLYIGQNKALVNGNEVTLDAAAKVIGNRVIVPLRFISQTLGTLVSYDPDTQLITVNDNNQ